MNYTNLYVTKGQYYKIADSVSPFKGSKCIVETTSSGSGFHSNYFHLKVYWNNLVRWDGGDALFKEESFGKNIISEEYYKVILIKSVAGESSTLQSLILIDLELKKEIELAEKHKYWDAGHFNSFDGAFYRKSTIKDYLCKDFENGTDFLLYERINAKIKNAFEWSVTSIRECILVYTREYKDNVILYNIRKSEIVDFITIDFNLSVNGRIISHLDKQNNKLIIHTIDNDLNEKNIPINHRDNFFEITF